MKFSIRFPRNLALVACLTLVVSAPPALAQSQASAAVSMLPVASLAVTASALGAGVAAASQAAEVLAQAGATFVVKGVEATARGSVYVLERVSDGVRVGLAVSGEAASASTAAVGTSVTTTVMATGIILSTAGTVLAFLPNEAGKALLHNERLSR